MFVLNPKKHQDEIFEVAVKTCESIHQGKVSEGDEEELTKEEKLGKLLGAFLCSNSEATKNVHEKMFLSHENAHDSQPPLEPTCFEEAVSSPKWKEAMDTEIRFLCDCNVWDPKLVVLPEGQTAVGSKWVYKIKTGVDGSQQCIARLVAQEKSVVDYDETFSPAILLESLRTLIALSVQRGMNLHQIHVTTAVLSGELEGDVYMKQPRGFVAQGKGHLVRKLKKSIYGLKQSSPCWKTALDEHLKKEQFTQSVSDPCVYAREHAGKVIYIGVYVDNIVLAGSNNEEIRVVKDALANKFIINNICISEVLGMEIVKVNSKEIWIGQPKYAKALLRKFGIEQSKPFNTPIDPSLKVLKGAEDDKAVDPKKYQSAIGSLQYLSDGTRLDIAYAVSSLSRFTAKPTKQHWSALKRILCYLKCTTNHGILYKKDGVQAIVGYSDDGWDGSLADRRSTSGYLFQIGGGAVAWKSRRESCAAMSSEAECTALATAVQEAV